VMSAAKANVAAERNNAKHANLNFIIPLLRPSEIDRLGCP
jgi:hypothetical protein